MKKLISIIKGCYFVSVAIALSTVYAVFTKGIEWIPFCAMAFFLAYQIKKGYEEMEQDITDALNTAVKEIWDACRNEESQEFTLEYLHNGKRYYIIFDYYVTYTEVIGATFMGDYERLAEKDIEQIIIKDFECRNDDTDEIIDCGFTIKDLQDAL